MKAKSILLFFTSALILSACHDEARIQVTNRVHNVRLDNISYSNVRIGSNLLPGETTEATVSDRYEEVSFPATAPLEFYMVKGDRRIYLKTKEFFRLDADEMLEIVIADDTELVNGIK
jgi:hypothetical protein